MPPNIAMSAGGGIHPPPLYCEAEGCGRRLEKQRRRTLHVLACPVHGEWTPNGHVLERDGGLRKINTTKRQRERCMKICLTLR